jgi:hypothetical protein
VALCVAAMAAMAYAIADVPVRMPAGGAKAQ